MTDTSFEQQKKLSAACGLGVGPGLRLRVTDRSGVRSEFVVDRYE